MVKRSKLTDDEFIDEGIERCEAKVPKNGELAGIRRDRVLNVIQDLCEQMKKKTVEKYRVKRNE